MSNITNNLTESKTKGYLPEISLKFATYSYTLQFMISPTLSYLYLCFSFLLPSDNVSSWKILVSSTTNVAVDRILLG